MHGIWWQWPAGASTSSRHRTRSHCCHNHVSSPGLVLVSCAVGIFLFVIWRCLLLWEVHYIYIPLYNDQALGRESIKWACILYRINSKVGTKSLYWCFELRIHGITKLNSVEYRQKIRRKYATRLRCLVLIKRPEPHDEHLLMTNISRER